ncbi:MAG: TIGR00730 family Rossman fold protein [Rhizobiales bacterium]|nr:TIGR00730 family Rossman fold protein [Hyphomicrobiales bacterium]
MTSQLKNICVYCGSSTGSEPSFLEAAETFGRILAYENVGLVYGGGGIGIMGVIARTVMQENGRVTGIIPDFLQKREVRFDEVSEFIVTTSMHERKQLMFERSDAFVVLPGGIGTLEEAVEMLTWAQLGRHNLPIIIANLNGFWDPLIELFDHIIKAGFARSNIRGIYAVVDKVEDILPRIRATL